MEAETFVRNDAVLADVDTRLRLIDLVAVPWDQEAEIVYRDEYWNEVFRRGAFDGLEDHIGRIMVNREHVKGVTVGKLVWADPKSEQGLITRAKIAPTEKGDETLALAAEDMVAPSVGYRIKEEADVKHHRRTRLREVFRAFLDHLSLVESPAYTGAQILAVREKAEGVNPPEFVRTLDEAWSDPEYLRAVERLNKVSSGD